MLRLWRGTTVLRMSTATRNSLPALHDGLCPGAYFTDGIRLYRVANTLLDPWKGGCVELEDCMTLKTSCYVADALELLHLEQVQPLAA